MTVGPHLLGRVPSTYDDRDHRLTVEYARLLTVTAPPTAMAAPTRSRPKDQGQTPRCVGYSGEFGRLIGELPDVHHVVRFDPNDIYDRCKQLDGDPTGDGTSVRVAIGVLMDPGAVVTTAAKSSGVAKGDRLRIAGYARLRTINDVKLAIANFRSAWFGLPWYNSWFDPTLSGTAYILPVPDSVAGGHAIEAVGYDDALLCPDGTRGAFLLWNTWGKSWAHNSEVWLPYSYIDLSATMDWEAWRTTDVAGDR